MNRSVTACGRAPRSGGAGPILRLAEPPAELDRLAEQRHRGGRDLDTPDPLRVGPRAADRAGAVAKGGRVLERLLRRTPAGEVQLGERRPLGALGRNRFLDVPPAGGVGKWQAAPHDRVDDRTHRGVHTDAEASVMMAIRVQDGLLAKVRSARRRSASRGTPVCGQDAGGRAKVARFRPARCPKTPPQPEKQSSRWPASPSGLAPSNLLGYLRAGCRSEGVTQ